MFTTLVKGASRFIANRSGRSFVPEPALVGEPGSDSGAPITKTFRVPRSGSVRIPDLRALTSVSFGGLALSADAFELVRVPTDEYPAVFIDVLDAPTGMSAYNLVTPQFRGPTVAITGRWGIWPVPEDVQVATAMLAARMFARKDARYADQVQAGIESAGFSYYKSLPDDIRAPIEMLRVRKVALI